MKTLRNRTVLAFLLFNLLAGALYVGGALLVTFMRSFGTTPAQLGWILAAGWGASGLGALAGGQLADNVGPRRTVLLSAALVAAALLGKSLARHWLQAGAWYLVGMSAQAALFPAGMALLRDAVGDKLGSSWGFLNTALSAAAIPGAALTGWMVSRWDWPVLFLGKFATYLVALPVLFLLLPEVKRQLREEGQKARWQEALACPALLWVCASVFVVTLGGYCHAFYPYFVQEQFTADVRKLAVFDSIYNGVWMLSNWPAGLLADQLGRGRMAMMGYGLMGLAWLFFPLGPSLSLLYLFYAVYCLGNSIGFYASIFAQDVAPAGYKGRAVGLFNATMHLGTSLGDGAGGLLWQKWGARFSFALAAAANLLGASLLFGARERRGPTAEGGGARVGWPGEPADA